jgi:putative ABC transport system permease protein
VTLDERTASAARANTATDGGSGPSRRRAALATVTSAPWRRAPWLLRRRPGVLATVAGACVVLAAPLAAVPLFLSSAGTEAVTVQADERCARDTGVTASAQASPEAVADPGPDPFRSFDDTLTPSVRWARMDDVNLAGPNDEVRAAVLSRDGALDHVEVIEGTPGPGAWLSDRGAEEAGVGIGDEVAIDGVAVPVAGIYRDLAGLTVDDHWCSHTEMFLLHGADRDWPPPVVLADPATFADLLAGRNREGSPANQPVVAWEAHLRDDVTVAEAEALVDGLACRDRRADGLEWCVDGQAVMPGWRGFGRRDDAPRLHTVSDEVFVTSYLDSSLPFVGDRARAIRTSVGGGVWPVAVLAALAGVGFVAAAASLWADRRRRELRLLSVRGVSPAGLGLKAVLELAAPLVVGTAAGVVLAYGLVRWLGPSSTIEPGAIRQAAVAGAAALAVAVVTVGAVVTGRNRGGRHARTTRAAWLRLVPWEVGLGLLTLASYGRLGEWGVSVSQGADVSRVDVLGLLFPVLFLLTGVAVVVRLLALGLRPLLSASRRWPVPAYLAVRRVARYRVAVLGLVAASALAGGVLGYAATLDRSLDASLEAKAKTFVGSDVAVQVTNDAALPSAVAGQATELAVYRRAWVGLDGVQREGVIVLAVDPDTFEQAAFWDEGLASESLGELLDRLTPPAAGGRVPAVLVGAHMIDTAEAGISYQGTTRFDVERVAEVEAFPGMRRQRPTLVVAQSALEPLDIGGATREAWVAADHDDTLAALDAAGVEYVEARSFGEVADRTAFLTVSWTFGFMQTLGVAAGLLALGGTAAYLDARRRGRVLGYAFARRMGLTRNQHRRALWVELTASVVVGCWLGLAIALAGAWLAHRRIDPVPAFAPDPLFRPALAVVVALAAGAVVVAGVAAALAQRRTDRDDPVEVLRAGA